MSSSSSSLALKRGRDDGRDEGRDEGRDAWREPVLDSGFYDIINHLQNVYNITVNSTLYHTAQQVPGSHPHRHVVRVTSSAMTFWTFVERLFSNNWEYNFINLLIKQRCLRKSCIIQGRMHKLRHGGIILYKGTVGGLLIQKALWQCYSYPIQNTISLMWFSIVLALHHLHCHLGLLRSYYPCLKTCRLIKATKQINLPSDWRRDERLEYLGGDSTSSSDVAPASAIIANMQGGKSNRQTDLWFRSS